MKPCIVLIGFLLAFFCAAGTTFAQKDLEKCPDIKPVEPIPIKSLLGTWYAMRVGPPYEEYGNQTWDCVTETYWIDKETPENIVNTLYHHRIGGTDEDYQGTINTTKTTQPESEYVWEYSIFDMKIPTTFVATDGGRSWAIAYSCMEMEPNNATMIWGISSRTRTIDPKLEQTLVHEIEKYSGVQADELFGIGQNDCF